jgi:hypothetical protein
MVTVELSGASRTLEVVAAVLLLAGVTFVVARTALAQRRGEDARLAAAGALRAVGPPVFLAVLSLILLSVMAGFFAILLVIVFLSALGGEPEVTGSAVLVFFGGLVLLLVAVVGAVIWGVARILRFTRARQ